MNTSKILFLIHAALFSSVAAIGCAGTLTPEEADSLRLAHSTSGDGTTTGTTGTGGAGGGSGVDMCMKALVAPPPGKSCGLENSCHGGTTPQAGMILDEAAVSMGFKTFVDKANVGTQPTDGPLGCQMGKYKLIDSANPANSMIYLKVTMQPCGGLMPIGLPLTDTERACVLSWINTVIAAP